MPSISSSSLQLGSYVGVSGPGSGDSTLEVGREEVQVQKTSTVGEGC